VEDHDGLDQRRHPELPLSFVGIDPVNWFGSMQGAIVSVLIIDTWATLPFVALILLEGCRLCPTEPYEAPRVDGAGPVAMLRYVTLPLLSPFIVLVVLFRTMDSQDLRRDLPTTLGGPNDATPTCRSWVSVFLPVVPDGQGHGAAIVLLLLVVSSATC